MSSPSSIAVTMSVRSASCSSKASSPRVRRSAGSNSRGEPEPPAHGLEELVREIDLIDLDEPGRRNQLGLGSVRRDRSRALADRPSMIPPRQAGRGEVGEEGRSTSGNEDPPARSQHGELRGQSTEYVGVDDGVVGLAVPAGNRTVRIRRTPRTPVERRDVLGGLIHEYRWAA